MTHAVQLCIIIANVQTNHALGLPIPPKNGPLTAYTPYCIPSPTPLPFTKFKFRFHITWTRVNPALMVRLSNTDFKQFSSACSEFKLANDVLSINGIHPSSHPDSKVHGANIGLTWGRQDSGGPHVGHMNLAIWAVVSLQFTVCLNRRGETT